MNHMPSSSRVSLTLYFASQETRRRQLAEAAEKRQKEVGDLISLAHGRPIYPVRASAGASFHSGQAVAHLIRDVILLDYTKSLHQHWPWHRHI